MRKQILTKWKKHFSLRPEIFRRRHHQIEVSRISKNALKVIKQLHEEGYSAYLVGGGVRDLLVGQTPKDFDVVTDAKPEQIRKLFGRSRIIGRRFRLVHVYFRSEIIEVSTYRANSQESSRLSPLAVAISDQPPILSHDNTYGTIEEDAWRRDFTVNALYFDSVKDQVVDYTQGMKDIKLQCIQMIGEPIQRFHEDPIRLLRAIRLAAKLDFTLDSKIQECIRDLAGLLYHVPEARILDEMMKLFFKGFASKTYKLLQEYGYSDILFPLTAVAIQENTDHLFNRLIELALKTTDYRYDNNMSLNPGFLFSVFLWPALQKQLEKEQVSYPIFTTRLRIASSHILNKQHEICLISKRMRQMMRSIWLLQYYLLAPKPHRVLRIMSHRYFRAALDLLQLRVEAGEPYGELAIWWQRLRVTGDRSTCKNIIAELKSK